MSSERQKTILLSIQYWRAITSILRTEVLSLLKKEGFRIVIASPYSRSKDFIKEFEGENVFFEDDIPGPANNIPELARKGLLLLVTAASSFLTYPTGYFIRKFCLSIPDIGNIKLLKTGWRSIFFAKMVFPTGKAILIILAASSALILVPFVRLGILGKESIFALRDKTRYRIFWNRNKRYIEALLAKYKPGLVCVSKMYYCPIENVIVNMARVKEIPSLGIYVHLDGILSAAMAAGSVNRISYVDRMLTCSQTVKEEIAQAYNLEESKIGVTGYSGYDVYSSFLKKRGRLSQEEFFAQEGFDKKKKLLILATPVIFLLNNYQPSYFRIVDYVVSCVVENKFAYPCQLFIRLHPSDNSKTYAFLKKEFSGKKDIFVTWAGKKPGGARGDFEYFAEIMTYADVMIAGSSGVAIDAAIFDLPTVPWVTENRLGVFEKYVFPALELFEPQDMVKRVNEYLANPSLGKEERARVVRELCGQIDGQACRRIAEEIKRMYKTV